MATGDYTHEFCVEMLVSKKRPEPGKPTPDFHFWKGRRILYCTEPKQDDVLNTGTLKEITGGEKSHVQTSACK